MLRIPIVAAFVAVAGLGLAPVVLAAAAPYGNCSEAHADGRYDIPRGDDAYWDDGDRDQDGIACES